MKGVLFSAVAFTLPVCAMIKTHTQEDEEKLHIKNQYHFEHPKQPIHEVPEVDLFRKDAPSRIGPNPHLCSGEI